MLLVPVLPLLLRPGLLLDPISRVELLLLLLLLFSLPLSFSFFAKLPAALCSAWAELLEPFLFSLVRAGACSQGLALRFLTPGTAREAGIAAGRGSCWSPWQLSISQTAAAARFFGGSGLREASGSRGWGLLNPFARAFKGLL